MSSHPPIEFEVAAGTSASKPAKAAPKPTALTGKTVVSNTDALRVNDGI